jgi:ABC-2 type transport system permease protein
MSTRARAVRRPLPLAAEVRRQLGRRRTRLILGFLLLLPLLLVGAFALGGDDEPGAAPSFVDLAQVGAANLTVFTLFASTGFLLVVVVALFWGDAVPAEASWASLRYLLVAPVPRARLLTVKLAVAALSTAVALVLLPAWTLLVGLVAYGGAPYQGLAGETIAWADFWPRLGLAVAYLFVNLLFVGALAFFVGTLTDAPLGAVGTAVVVTIVSSILDTIDALGDLRDALPTHFQFAWADVLAADVDGSGMATGATWSVGWAVLLLAASYVVFARKDVLT